MATDYLSVANMVNLVLCGTETVLLFFLVKSGIRLFDKWPHPAFPLRPIQPLIPLNPPIQRLHPPAKGCMDPKSGGIQLTLTNAMACPEDRDGEKHFISNDGHFIYIPSCITYLTPEGGTYDAPVKWNVIQRNNLGCHEYLQGPTAEGTVNIVEGVSTSN